MLPISAHLPSAGSRFLPGALVGWVLSESSLIPLSGLLLPYLIQVCLNARLALHLGRSRNLSPQIRVYTTWEIPSNGHVTPGHRTQFPQLYP